MATSAKNGSGIDAEGVADAESVLESTVDAPVTNVEWWAHRRVGADASDVVVYRGEVDDAAHGAYFVVLGEHAREVYPVSAYDSVVNLVAAYRAETTPERE
jgi:hypothetical protein